MSIVISRLEMSGELQRGRVSIKSFPDIDDDKIWCPTECPQERGNPVFESRPLRLSRGSIQVPMLSIYLLFYSSLSTGVSIVELPIVIHSSELHQSYTIYRVRTNDHSSNNYGV